MSFHYLIDGFNVLYALSDFPSGTWEAKREALVKKIARQAPQGKNRITVVFDSREGSGSLSKWGDIQIAFTAGETADDWISHYVRRNASPRTLIVVTDDQGLRRLIRGTGAKWLSTREFWQKAKTSPSPGPDREPIADKDSITEEFKDKWL